MHWQTMISWMTDAMTKSVNYPTSLGKVLYFSWLPFFHRQTIGIHGLKTYQCNRNFFLLHIKSYMKLLIWKRIKKLKVLLWNEDRRPGLSLTAYHPFYSKMPAAWGYFMKPIFKDHSSHNLHEALAFLQSC